jgi:predicted amidohydrolase YtcJ
MTAAALVLDRVRIARPGRPAVPGAVVIADGRIAWLGSPGVQVSDLPVGVRDIVGRRDPRRIDCGGAVLYPGFVDPHCHPLALGWALTAANCRPPGCRSLADIQRSLRRWASEHPAEPWVRAFGYDELQLTGGSHPTRRDLDAAVSDRPVQLVHGSGHGMVLNSAGLLTAGITESTDEPVGGFIDREPDTGLPSGLLLEMAGFVAERTRAYSDADSARRYAEVAGDAFVRAGVTSVTDAGPSNDLSTLRLWASLRSSGTFLPRTTVMCAPGVRVPPGALSELGPHLELGPAKVVLSASGGRVDPDGPVLDRIVDEAVATGAGVAVHAVEAEAVLAACAAFERATQSTSGLRGPSGPLFRIEHAAEAPPEVCAAIRRSGATVVTQPGFVVARGDRYLAAARSGGCDPDDLYAVRSLLEAGIPVRASSDAPYGPVSPLMAMHGATARTSASGAPVGRSQVITVAQAQALCHGPVDRDRGGTRDSTWAGLNSGDPADLVLLSEDPQDVASERLPEIEVLATVISGEVAWEAG